MDTVEDHKTVFQIGDIVSESTLIVPPERKPWVGIVVYVKKDYYDLHSYNTFLEDMVGIQWFKPGYIESLPSSVVVLVRRAEEKKEEKA
jgi:hypothetical protein